MMKTNYNPVSEKLYSNYLRALIGKFYKILPMYEEQSPTIDTYISSLIFELTGGVKIIEEVKYDGRYLSLISVLGNLSNCNDLKVCKREVFKCIRNIEEMINEYEGR